MAATCIGLEFYQEALQHLLKVLSHLHGTESRLGEYRVLERLGISYYKIGDLDSALSYLKKGLPLARENKHILCEKQILKHMGLVFMEKSKIHDAIGCLSQYHNLLAKFEDKDEEKIVIEHLTRLLTRGEDKPRIIALLHRGLSLGKETNDPKYEGLILKKLGDIHLKTRDGKNAADYFEKSIDLWKTLGDLDMETSAYEGWKQAMSLNEKTTTHNAPEPRFEEPAPSSEIGTEGTIISQMEAFFMIQLQANMFAEAKDNDKIEDFLKQIEGISRKFDLDMRSPDVRGKFRSLINFLRKKNCHACATILKNRCGSRV